MQTNESDWYPWYSITNLFQLMQHRRAIAEKVKRLTFVRKVGNVFPILWRG